MLYLHIIMVFSNFIKKLSKALKMQNPYKSVHRSVVEASCYLYCHYVQSNKTPLHLASMTGEVAVVQLLLDRGASLTAVDEVCEVLY